MPTRLDRLRQQLRAVDLEAIVLIPGPNLFYMTELQFHLSERPTLLFIPVDGECHVVLPAFEQGKAQLSTISLQPHGYTDAEGPRAAVVDALATLDIAPDKLAVEARRMRFLELQLLEGFKPVNGDPQLAALRMRKDLSELKHMKTAVAIAERAFRELLPSIHPGITEREVAAQLTSRIYAAGSEPELPFHPFAAAGVNGANPHATATDRPLQSGDLVTIDWGASHGNYFSDITRNVTLGELTQPRLQEAYEVVLAANEAGRQAVRPGVTGQDIDRATRKVVVDAGLGEFFTHRTGHGLGLEGHEEPDMNEGSLVLLEPGMTFTIEPGVYIPGVGGLRIEDDIVVTDTGGESLTTLSRELVVLGQ